MLLFDVKALSMKITLERIDHGDTSHLFAPQFLADLTALARNINPDSAPVTEETMRRFLIRNGYLACCWNDDNKVVGMATSILLYKLTGYSARIEHVSVLPVYEGQGIARKLVTLLVEECRLLKVRRIELTCEPKRVVANNLYESLGFKLRETNSRRLTLVL